MKYTRLANNTLPYALSLLGGVAMAQEKPNILWLWIEDTSYYNFGVTGNPNVITPTIDSLAKNGVLFTNAYSIGPQSSPARSTLITGMYSFATASDWHRQQRAVPNEFYFPQYLKKANYYTSNNYKTDYNSTVDNLLMWNVSSGSAHYKNRSDKSKPFFSVFNFGDTHMSSITDVPIEKRKPRMVMPSDVTLPSYLPEGDSLRDDRAWHLDMVVRADAWVANKLKELKELGEDENTIIFFSSDHGGCTPGSKGFLRQDGVKIPLIAYFPEKWAHLKDGLELEEGYKSDRMVGFVDLGPTMLSIAGLEQQSHFHGKPFLGKGAVAPRENILTFRCNQDASYIPSRSIIDNQYKFIWNYNTMFRKGMVNGFQWGMEGYREWERMFYDGELTGLPLAFWEQEMPFELYDLKADSAEMHNLAYEPEYQVVLASYKEELGNQLRDIKDLGLYPQSMRRVAEKEAFYTYVRRTKEDVSRVIETAEIASAASEGQLTELTSRLEDDNQAVRFWAAIGLARIAQAGTSQTAFPDEQLKAMLQDAAELPDVKAKVATALVYRDYHNEAFAFLLEYFAKGNSTVATTMEALGAELQPAASLIRDMALAAKNGYANYTQSDIRKYNNLLVYAHVLPYNLRNQTNITLWSPYVNVLSGQLGSDCFEVPNKKPSVDEISYPLPFSEKMDQMVYNDDYTPADAMAYLTEKGWKIGELHPGIKKVNTVTVQNEELGGYITTPKLDVAPGTAVQINFYARMAQNDVGATPLDKKNNNLNHRNFFVVIGSDTIYNHVAQYINTPPVLMQNLNKWTVNYIYQGEEDVQVKFFAKNDMLGVWQDKVDGLMIGNNKGTGLEIKAMPTTGTALNIGFGENIDLGTLIPGRNLVTIPIKALNLKAPIELVAQDEARVVIANASLGDEATAESPLDIDEQLGAEIVVGEQELGKQTVGVTLRSQNLPDRKLWLNYEVATASSVETLKKEPWVVATKTGLKVKTTQKGLLYVYDLSGKAVYSSMIKKKAAHHIELPSDMYIVKLAHETKKVEVP